MGGNTGDGYRNGQVKDRKQVFNSRTGQYVKINTQTGRIMGSKETPYKGVRDNSKSKETK